MGSLTLTRESGLQVNFPDGVASLALSESGLTMGYADGIGMLQITEDQLNLTNSGGKSFLYAQQSILRMTNVDDTYQGLELGLQLESGAKVYGPSGVAFGVASFNIAADGLTIKGLAGTAGQVLESAGAGVAPVWVDLPSAYVNPLKCLIILFLLLQLLLARFSFQLYWTVEYLQFLLSLC